MRPRVIAINISTEHFGVRKMTAINACARRRHWVCLCQKIADYTSPVIFSFINPITFILRLYLWGPIMAHAISNVEAIHLSLRYGALWVPGLRLVPNWVLILNGVRSD